jgi:F0F1-type ATP synthase assembly protein I
MEESRPTENKKNHQNSRLNDYAKYSGLAFQMGAIIGVAAWGGIKLDELAENNKPTFTIILSLLGVFAAIYLTLKDLIKKQ